VKRPILDFTKADRGFAQIKALIADLQETWSNRHLLIKEVQHSRAVLYEEDFEFDETLYMARGKSVDHLPTPQVSEPVPGAPVAKGTGVSLSPGKQKEEGKTREEVQV
jgi:hypothetical protein